MNLAFPAFLLLLLYLPGALFLSGYWGKLSKDRELPVLSLSLTGRAALALIIAFAFHALWLGLGELLSFLFDSTWHPIPEVILAFLAGQNKEADFKTLSRSLWPMFVYFSSLFTSSWALGFAAHQYIRRRRLDQKRPWLRFSNYWHYLFLFSSEKEMTEELTGERFGGRNTKSKSKRNPYLEILIDVDDAPYVYSGLLEGYWFNKEGDLELIALSSVARVNFNDLENLIVLGDAVFYFKFSDIKSMSFSILITDDDDDDDNKNNKPEVSAGGA